MQENLLQVSIEQTGAQGYITDKQKDAIQNIYDSVENDEEYYEDPRTF